jgi:hypothetical protein
MFAFGFLFEKCEINGFKEISALVYLKPADRFDAWSGEDFLLVRRLRKLGREVLPGKMELFMEVCAPLRAIADVIDNALKSDPFWVAAFSRAAA